MSVGYNCGGRVAHFKLTGLKAVMNIVCLFLLLVSQIDLSPLKMFSVPAACIAAIFACRSFVRVSTYVC